MNLTDIVQSPSNASLFLQFDVNTSGSEVITGDQSAAPFVLSPPAMLGGLPVQTVSFILLGVGAAAPIVFLTFVAVALRLRRMRRSRHYSKYVLDQKDEYKDAWHENGFSGGKPVQKTEENGKELLQVPSYRDGTGRKESFQAGGIKSDEGYDKRYQRDSHDIDSAIKTHFVRTGDDKTDSRSFTENRSNPSQLSDNQVEIFASNDRELRGDDLVHREAKRISDVSQTTLLNVRALVETNKGSNGCDANNLLRRSSGAGNIQKEDGKASERLDFPPGSRTGSGISEESFQRTLNFRDSICRSVDSSISRRQETCQMVFQEEELDGRNIEGEKEEQEEGKGNENRSGSHGTSVYFDAETSPYAFRNSTSNLDPDLEKNRSFSSSAIASSSRRQMARAATALGEEEEQVLRCLDEVLSEYMDSCDDSQPRSDSNAGPSITAQL